MKAKELVDLIDAQAKELLKNDLVIESLNKLSTDEEKQQWLAIAAMYALSKANKNINF